MFLKISDSILNEDQTKLRKKKIKCITLRPFRCSIGPDNLGNITSVALGSFPGVGMWQGNGPHPRWWLSQVLLYPSLSESANANIYTLGMHI